MDFIIYVPTIQRQSYEKSMASLREKYEFLVESDDSLEIGKYRVEDLTENQEILPLFGIVPYEKSLKNRDTCMNPPAFLAGRCKKGHENRCLYWDQCIFERKGKK